MAKNNLMIEEIDEAAMLQSIYERDNPPKAQAQPVAEVQPVSPPETEQPEAETPGQTEKPKEQARRKRGNVDYSDKFLQRNELKARSCVYISQKVHATIAKIVKMISEKDVTVGGYIDNILMEHLETHRDEITELYQRQLKKESDNSLIEF
jgi:type IV secretory pathway VirB10-like protein